MFDRIFESKISAYILIIVILVVMMGPIYWTVTTGFKPDMETYIFPPIYFPKHPTIEPFKLLFEYYPFTDYVRNSIIVTLSTTVVVTVFGMFAAYGIAVAFGSGQQTDAPFPGIAGVDILQSSSHTRNEAQAFGLIQECFVDREPASNHNAVILVYLPFYNLLGRIVVLIAAHAHFPEAFNEVGMVGV